MQPSSSLSIVAALPDVPPATLTISPKAVVCVRASFTGPFSITIADDAIIHPGCHIAAYQKNITIGRGCIIEEKVTLVGVKGDSRDGGDGDNVSVGASTILRVGCVVRASSIGNSCVIGIKSVIDTDAIIGNGVHIGNNVIIPASHVIPSNTSLVHPFVAGRSLPTLAMKQATQAEQQVVMLSQLLPRFHNLIKSTAT